MSISQDLMTFCAWPQRIASQIQMRRHLQAHLAQILDFSTSVQLLMDSPSDTQDVLPAHVAQPPDPPTPAWIQIYAGRPLDSLSLFAPSERIPRWVEVYRHRSGVIVSSWLDGYGATRLRLLHSHNDTSSSLSWHGGQPHNIAVYPLASVYLHGRSLDRCLPDILHPGSLEDRPKMVREILLCCVQMVLLDAMPLHLHQEDPATFWGSFHLPKTFSINQDIVAFHPRLQTLGLGSGGWVRRLELDPQNNPRLRSVLPCTLAIPGSAHAQAQFIQFAKKGVTPHGIVSQHVSV